MVTPPAHLGELTSFSRWGGLFPGWKLLAVRHALNSRVGGGNERGNAEKEGNSAFWNKAKGRRFIPLLTCLLNPILNTPACTGCVHCSEFYSEWERLKILFLMEKRWLYENSGEERGEATLLVQCARLASGKSVYFKCSILLKGVYRIHLQDNPQHSPSRKTYKNTYIYTHMPIF